MSMTKTTYVEADTGSTITADEIVSIVNGMATALSGPGTLLNESPAAARADNASRQPRYTPGDVFAVTITVEKVETTE